MHNEYGARARTEGAAGFVPGLRALFGPRVQVFSLDPESTRRRGGAPDAEVHLWADAVEPEDVLPLALRVSALLPGAVRREMAAIGFDDEAGLWLMTRSGTRILVGDQEDLERKLAIVAELVEAGRWRLIDVRYPRSPVVRTQ